jgi:hypothetical protein
MEEKERRLCKVIILKERELKSVRDARGGCYKQMENMKNEQ